MMFNDLLFDFFFGGRGYDTFHVVRPQHRCKKGECKCEKKREEAPVMGHTFTANTTWREETNNWYISISAPDADIRVDEKGIDVSYEYTEKTDHGSFSKSQKFFVTFPENSKPETVRAKRLGEKAIVVTVDKKVVEDPKDIRRRLTIE